ncbi:hypothetical protein Cenrod_0216 [Candidatus Symbiobacter mobilis CR]|uniref:Ubiquinone biosynthesis protein UbiJ n=2 Tax=Candidatus Symbiobacter TaxID=1436289 RepID=U5N860_9BURK|nr:hypothetical protein Cenrod_0216 [Candidatus Symbiobacter mobilis CR]
MLTMNPFENLCSGAFADLLYRLDGTARKAIDKAPRPPEWLVGEAQRKVIAAVNHVLGGCPVATERLRSHAGRVLVVEWPPFRVAVSLSTAGMFEWVPESTRSDLVLTLADPSLPAVLCAVARREKPSLRIEGDVALASDVHEAFRQLRWNAEEDLSCLVGPTCARNVVGLAREVGQGLRAFVQSVQGVPGFAGTPHAAPHKG